MPREERDETREGAGRKQRRPIGGPELKLSAPKRKGFVSRWVNDAPGRIQRFEEAGYKLREGYERLVGVAENGTPLKAYLMDIPESYYTEDQAAKQAQVDEVDAVIRHGQPHGAGRDTDSFYDAGTKVSSSKR